MIMLFAIDIFGGNDVFCRQIRVLLVLSVVFFSLAACKDPDERKTHYVTVIRSQDVEIREELVDTDLKKPTVVVYHPDGVDVRHLPTKPRKTISFEQLPLGFLAFLLLIMTISERRRSLRQARGNGIGFCFVIS